MLSVSAAFSSAAVEAYRKPLAKIRFAIVDVDANENSTETATSEAAWSRKEQTTELIRDMSYRYGTWEKDYIRLDGSYQIIDTSYVSEQIGWWSSLLSDATGTLAFAQSLTCQFSVNQSSIGISVSFDTQTDDCCSDFDILVYDAANALTASIAVTGNTSATYVWEYILNNYRKVVVRCLKTSKPYRRVRIAEVDFGVLKTYTSADLVQVGIVESMDPLSRDVSPNKIEIELENTAKLFNPLNPSGIYAYLQRRQKISAYMGYEVSGAEQYVPMGVYYLAENTSEQGALTAKLIGYDITDLLSQSTYRTNQYAAITLKALAEAVLADAGLTVNDYVVDTALASVTVNSVIPWISHRDALQLIANAGQAVMYSDRLGVLRIKRIVNASTGVTLNYDNLMDVPKIALEKLVNAVTVDVFNYQVDAATSEAYKGTVSTSGTQDVWVGYSNPYQSSSGMSAMLSAGTLNSATYYAYGAKLNITYTGATAITVTGYKLLEFTSQYSLTSTSKPPEEDTLSAAIKNNLITSTAQAQSVAAWALAEFEQRLKYSCDYRMSAQLEAGDVLTIQDDFSANKLARIIEQKFDYDGTLSGQVIAKGEVV